MRHLLVTCQGRWFSEKPAAKKTFKNPSFFKISPVFTDRFASLTYEKTQNCKRFPPNIVQSLCDASFVSYEPI